jgi:hypothetical protein
MMKYILSILLLLFVMSSVWAADTGADKKTAAKKAGDEAKELSGISIIGNKEAPKSLYIVPWKDSQVGVESSLTSGLLDERMQPVDKEVFMRELDYYQLTHGQ